MHDNARPHTAIHTRNFLQANNINVLPWPARSPDLNPPHRTCMGRYRQTNNISLWIPSSGNVATTSPTHSRAIITDAEVNNLIRGVPPDRLAECIVKRGGHTPHYWQLSTVIRLLSMLLETPLLKIVAVGNSHFSIWLLLKIVIHISQWVPFTDFSIFLPGMTVKLSNEIGVYYYYTY